MLQIHTVLLLICSKLSDSNTPYNTKDDTYLQKHFTNTLFHGSYIQNPTVKKTFIQSVLQ
jgi:hypothetical protein